MKRLALALIAVLTAGVYSVCSQVSVASAAGPLPVFDVHWHSPGSAGMEASLKAMKDLNVTHAVKIGSESSLAEKAAADGMTILPSLTLPCENGKMANIGIRCFDNGAILPDVERLRTQVKQGSVKALGEINAQYLGIAPNDPRLDLYYALAEEMDVPVGIHLGIGPPGAAYEGPGFPRVKSPNYRGFAGSPLLLEDVLLKHPKLRLYVMHAAYPFRDDMVYMLYMHPRLYVDVSVLQWAIPRPTYYRYLKELVEAGFGKRIMFGSDGSPQRLMEGIDAILSADFLTEDQRRDILFNNAAKFFKITSSSRK